MASYGFHSEAGEEYLTATQYYLEHASPFVATVSSQKLKPQFTHFLSRPQRGQ